MDFHHKRQILPKNPAFGNDDNPNWKVKFVFENSFGLVKRKLQSKKALFILMGHNSEIPG